MGAGAVLGGIITFGYPPFGCRGGGQNKGNGAGPGPAVPSARKRP
jgi:hypothetical protein